MSGINLDHAQALKEYEAERDRKALVQSNARWLAKVTIIGDEAFIETKAGRQPVSMDLVRRAQSNQGDAKP